MRRINPFWKLCTVLALGWMPALLDSESVFSAAGLHSLAETENPYWVAEEFVLLYVRAPLAVLSTSLLCLSPGLLLALAARSRMDAGVWLLYGFGLSIVVVSTAAAITQSMLAQPLRSARFVTLMLGLSIFSATLTYSFARLRHRDHWPWQQNHALAVLTLMVLAAWVVQAILTPKIYWETFTDDGAQAFECARLLLWQPVPFWRPEAGSVAEFPGISTMLFAYPTSWFVRLFGEIEAAARIPLIPALVVLYAAITALASQGRPKRLGICEHFCIWLGLSIYIVVMAFSATWDPYSADLASPTFTDTLLVLCLLGFLLSFWRQEGSWMILWLLLVCICRPSGWMMILMWVLAVVLVLRPRPWKLIYTTLISLFIFLILAQLLPIVLTMIDLPTPGTEHTSTSMLQRVNRYQVAEWISLAFVWKKEYLRRWFFLLLPSGILPALALLARRRQDDLTRCLGTLTLVYFGFLYVQARVGLHYFAPIMVLPLVVFWRRDFTRRKRGRTWFLMRAAACCLVAFYVSLPSAPGPITEARLIGRSLDVRFDGYEKMNPGLFRELDILANIVPRGGEPEVPDRSYGGGPLVWNYYAHHTDKTGQRANYVLQPAGDPQPAGTELLGRQGGAALYISDWALLAHHRALRPPSPAGSPVYTIPRRSMFYQLGPPLPPWLERIARSLGFDP